jgi:hypothetical protein
MLVIVTVSAFFVLYLLIFLFYHFYIYSHVYTLFGAIRHLHFKTEPVCPVVLQFCWWENIRDNKRDSVLLVWDKDSYTERFLVLFPCTCVLQPTLVHLYQTSSLLPSPLPIVASASLRLLYSLLYSEHINHTQVLGFFPFPYSSCGHSPLSVWPMSNNISAFVLDL